MHKKGFWIGYATGILLAVGGIWYYSYLVDHVIEVPPAEEVALMQLTDLDSNAVSLNDYKGKPMVVNYWATWCGPCVEEFPHFEKAMKEYGEKVTFVVISDEDIATIKKYEEKKGYGFIFLRSEKDFSSYGIMFRPLTYFMDAEGNTVETVSGGMGEREIFENVEEIAGS